MAYGPGTADGRRAALVGSLERHVACVLLRVGLGARDEPDGGLGLPVGDRRSDVRLCVVRQLGVDLVGDDALGPASAVAPAGELGGAAPAVDGEVLLEDRLVVTRERDSNT